MTDSPQEPAPAASTYTSAPSPTIELPDAAEPENNPQSRPRTVGVVAALAIGALIGGATGAGVGIWAVSGQSTNSAAENNSPTSITVNDPSDATTVTAVAASASPSVVTINVEGNDAGGTGSGVALTADGYILTNTHVVTLDGAAEGAEITVETNDGRLLEADIVGTDPISDLAVIKVDDSANLQPIEFADSTDLNVGDTAIVIGAPLGLSGSVSNGIVSALNRSITIASSAVPDDDTDEEAPAPDEEEPFDFWNFDIPGQETPTTQPSSTIALSVIQTDAAVNPGNSGGALVDSDGRVIGIIVAIATAGGGSGTSGSIGVGFAIPSNLAQRVAAELMEDGTASHGLLGASVLDVTEDDAQSDAVTVGASVMEIANGGAAEQAGLRVGDIVTSFNGVRITDKTDLTAQVRLLAAGAQAELTYLRDNRPVTVTVTLGEYK